MSVADIVHVKGEYYVKRQLRRSPMTAHVSSNTATLSPVLNRYGDIEPLSWAGWTSFHSETRHLSRMTLQLNSQTPMLLSSTIRDDNSLPRRGYD